MPACRLGPAACAQRSTRPLITAAGSSTSSSDHAATSLGKVRSTSAPCASASRKAASSGPYAGFGEPARGDEVRVLSDPADRPSVAVSPRASVSYSAARTLKSSVWSCALSRTSCAERSAPSLASTPRAPRARSVGRACRRAPWRDPVEDRVDVQHVRLSPAVAARRGPRVSWLATQASESCRPSGPAAIAGGGIPAHVLDTYSAGSITSCHRNARTAMNRRLSRTTKRSPFFTQLLPVVSKRLFCASRSRRRGPLSVRPRSQGRCRDRALATVPPPPQLYSPHHSSLPPPRRLHQCVQQLSRSPNSEPFRTPVPIESVHRFRRFHTLAEEKLVAAGAR